MVVVAVGRSSAASSVDAWIALAHCVEPDDTSLAPLLARVGPEGVVDRIRSGATGLRHGEGLAARLEGFALAHARDRADALGARIVTRDDAEWPSALLDLRERMPMALWVIGSVDLRLLGLRAVSLVGARACTAYGELIARTWAMDLATGGWAVVSGAAFGIDAAAHRGSMAAGGLTVAVLAGGVDVPYPRAHAALLAAIADQGAVVSEVPLGEPVRRQRFLSRNRIIAAIGRATVVVEAAERSGTTATARAAATMLRPVLAVPGPISSPLSAGCHRMVQDGTAMLASDVVDVVAAIDLTASFPAGQAARAAEDPPGMALHGAAGDGLGTASRDRLADREARLLDALPARAWADLAELIRSSGMAARDVLAGTSLLVAGGWLQEGERGWRRARVPPTRVPSVRSPPPLPPWAGAPELGSASGLGRRPDGLPPPRR